MWIFLLHTSPYYSIRLFFAIYRFILSSRKVVFCRAWIQYHQTIGKLNGFRKSTCHIRQIPLFSFKPKVSNTKGQLNPDKTNTTMVCVCIRCPAHIPQVLAAELSCEKRRKTEQWPLMCCDGVPGASLKETMP